MSIKKEKQVVETMIRIYCRHSEHNKELCSECSALMQYAFERLDRCPYGDAKKACRMCHTHCYKPSMRDKIRVVMRFSGPRMIFYAPIQTLKHWIK